MNNNRLSNTGILKAASKWLKLFNAGKLSPNSVARISANALNRSQIAGHPAYTLNSAFKHGEKAQSILLKDSPTHVRALKEGLAASPQFYSSKQLLNKSRGMYNAMADKVGPPQNASTFINAILKKPNSLLSAEEKALLPILKAYNKKVDTHKVWGFRPTSDKYLSESGQASFPISYLPRLGGVISIRPPGYNAWGNAYRAPNLTRHEIGHAFHAIAPKTFEKDVVGRSSILMRRFPHLIKTMEQHPLEHTAQYIASHGKSRGAQNYIKDTINYAGEQRPAYANNLTPMTPNELTGAANLAKQTLKSDPTGRDATAALHLTKNYLAPLPVQYTNPKYFNPNPYLP